MSTLTKFVLSSLALCIARVQSVCAAAVSLFIESGVIRPATNARILPVYEQQIYTLFEQFHTSFVRRLYVCSDTILQGSNTSYPLHPHPLLLTLQTKKQPIESGGAYAL